MTGSDDQHGYYPVTQYTTHLETYKVKEVENVAQRLANKIRKNLVKISKKQKIEEERRQKHLEGFEKGRSRKNSKEKG